MITGVTIPERLAVPLCDKEAQLILVPSWSHERVHKHLKFAHLLCDQVVLSPSFLLESPVTAAFYTRHQELLKADVCFSMNEATADEFLQKKRRVFSRLSNDYSCYYETKEQILSLIESGQPRRREDSIELSIDRHWTRQLSSIESLSMRGDLTAVAGSGIGSDLAASLLGFPDVRQQCDLPFAWELVRTVMNQHLLKATTDVASDVQRYVHQCLLGAYFASLARLASAAVVTFGDYRLRDLDVRMPGVRTVSVSMFERTLSLLGVWWYIARLNDTELLSLKGNPDFRTFVHWYLQWDASRQDNLVGQTVQDISANVLHPTRWVNFLLRRALASFPAGYLKAFKQTVGRQALKSHQQAVLRTLCDTSLGHTDERLMSILSDQRRQTVACLRRDVERATPAQHSHAGSSSVRVDVLLVTVIGEESDAALRRLGRSTGVFTVDGQTFHSGSVSGSSGKLRLAVLQLLDYGNVASAVAVTRALSLAPRFVVLVGIAGGVEADGVSRGDIVVAKFVYYYGLTKAVPGRLEIRGRQCQVDAGLLSAAQACGHRNWKSRVSVKPPAPTCGKVHFGPIAAGETVVADPATVDALRKQCPGLKAIAMEGWGVAQAAQHSNFPFIEVRGVSDLADPSKRDDPWRQYASDIATAYVWELLCLLADSDSVGVQSANAPE